MHRRVEELDEGVMVRRGDGGQVSFHCYAE